MDEAFPGQPQQAMTSAKRVRVRVIQRPLADSGRISDDTQDPRALPLIHGASLPRGPR